MTWDNALWGGEDEELPPFPMIGAFVQHAALPTIDPKAAADEDKVKILSGNAKRLLGM